MQTGILIGLAFVVVCWVLVLGHQPNAFDPDQFAVLQGFTAVAYVGAGLSVCAVTIAALSFFKKCENVSALGVTSRGILPGRFSPTSGRFCWAQRLFSDPSVS